MSKTRHMQQRMSQRGITSEIIEMLLRFGVSDGDKIILTRKNCQLLSKLFADLKRRLHSCCQR